MQQPDASLTIRPALPADCPLIYEFLCDLEEATLDATVFRAIYRRNLRDVNVCYRVADVRGEVVGFVSCHVQYLLHHTGRVGEIQELYVRPDYRNRQIGRQLIAELEDVARRDNFVNLEVTTNQRRTDTIRFYEQAGFRSSHRKLVKALL